jgi:ParB family chromosome partitioning protein
MSRKDTLNALFGMRSGDAPAPETKGAPAPALGAPNTASEGQGDGQPSPSGRVRAGAVGAMGASLRDIAREADLMRERIASGEQVLEIDAELIDPAPFTDRLVIAVDPAFEALVASIRESGQQVPALVRPHPSEPGRYQAAYGHRRIRACQALGRPVRAVVKMMDDSALAVAQGQENIARRDLSFIEKAVFAAGLESSGLPRAAILQALATDKGDLSRYIAVTKTVPIEIVRAIGPAPKAGRARWLALAEALRGAGWGQGPRRGKLPDRLQAMLEKNAFAEADSDARLMMVMATLSPNLPKAGLKPPAALDLKDTDGRLIGRLTHSRDTGGRTMAAITLTGDDPPGFAAFLASEIPGLHRRWKDSGMEGAAMQEPET